MRHGKGVGVCAAGEPWRVDAAAALVCRAHVESEEAAEESLKERDQDMEATSETRAVKGNDVLSRVAKARVDDGCLVFRQLRARW